MADAYVLNKIIDSPDRAKVQHILADAGYNPFFGVEPNPTELDPAADIGVICLPADQSELEALERAVEAFALAGIRVVTIFLSENVAALPESVGNFGAAAVCIGSPDIEKALQGEPIWEEANGTRRAVQPLRRNKC